MNLPPELSNLDVLLDRALRTGGETDGFDFKEHLDFQKNGEHRIKLLKAIGSFVNTDKGGHIIIGVSNDRRVVGVTPELLATYDQTPVQRLAGEYFAPAPAVQVRHHQREGKHLVFIEVRPFTEIPSIVKRYEVQGKEKLQDGTFLVRSAAAESGLLTTEVELRRLCDAIAARRAQAILSLTSQGGAATDEAERLRVAVRNGLKVLKVEADRMRGHARQVNALLYSGSAGPYLPLLLRPALLESVVPQIIDHVQDSQLLGDELALLRTAAAAADEETRRLLDGGGSAERLIPLLLNVMSSAASVSREVDVLLK